MNIKETFEAYLDLIEELPARAFRQVRPDFWPPVPVRDEDLYFEDYLPGEIVGPDGMTYEVNEKGHWK